MKRYTIRCGACKASHWTETADAHGHEHACPACGAMLSFWRSGNFGADGIFAPSRWRALRWKDRGDGGHDCDSRCRSAQGPNCECKCRGKNHGADA